MVGYMLFFKTSVYIIKKYFLNNHVLTEFVVKNYITNDAVLMLQNMEMYICIFYNKHKIYDFYRYNQQPFFSVLFFTIFLIRLLFTISSFPH